MDKLSGKFTPWEFAMKKCIVALLAVTLLFSFVGCTQYDYSYLWWYQQQKGESAQNIADRTDIKGIITGAFDKATIT